MDNVHSTTNERQKGKHLTFEERVIIQTRLKDKWSPNRIAKELGCSSNTVRNEIKRGTVALYNGNVMRYKAKAGQDAYEKNRQVCCRHYLFLERNDFLDYVRTHFFDDEWSLDSCAGRALEDGEFTRDETLCTKTLYNYVDKGLLAIKNIDLPEKLKRNKRTPHVKAKENKRVLGRSIDERSESVQNRKEFGHWECDLVIGAKDKDDAALLTMIERMTREFWVIRIPGKRPDDVMKALESLREQYSNHWNEIFKTITTDNGSEFANLSDIEKLSTTLIYFAHPYTSYEKGSVERHNRLIRRFIPKGKRIDSYSNEQIAQIEVWCNNLPRKLLGYKTPDELFESELDRIYGLTA